MKFVLTSLLLLFALNVPGTGQMNQQINPELLTKRWAAKWIAVPGASPFEYGIYHFRRRFNLAAQPTSFVVHVTADNRYQLYVNGERVVWGPARGDLLHWRYETIDIARYLKSGENVLAAVVWNYAEHAPEAQVTNQTGFLLQGNTAQEQIVNTGAEWRGVRNEAYSPLPVTHGEMRGYFVAGPGDRVAGAEYPWGWEQSDYDDSRWAAATFGGRDAGAPRGMRDASNRWMLVPRPIPPMEEQAERFASVREVDGIDRATLPAAFPSRLAAFQIPARTKARLLIDRAHLTTGYPELITSGGKDAVISIGYAEALFEIGKGRNAKGNRNEVAGKEFVGYRDVFIADGGQGRMFRPLWWRTCRYVELKIETGDAPLTIEDFRFTYASYPFERRARFDAGAEGRAARLPEILNVGWRTARLCAHETYMDTPYYEQLQYAGDTRIQALISYYNSGDRRLARNAIGQLDDSRTAQGITMSRAPTRQQQFIPPFSLWWIGMVHDYWMYTDDSEFVQAQLPGVRAVLTYYAGHQKQNGSLDRMPWWNFVDWTSRWESGVPPLEANGSSAPLDLQLLLAYRWAAALEATLGSQNHAAEYRQRETTLRTVIQNLYWDDTRKLYADTPAKTAFSQQTNALAVLADVITGEAARDLVRRTIADDSLTKSSFYFRHYLHSAVHKVGDGDRLIDLLDDWRAMLNRGLTTWAEVPDEARNGSRSDSHAWSASPNFEIFRTTLGINSAAPGFKRIIIQPFPGKLTQVSGTIPHPQGEIAVSYRLTSSGLQAEVELPPGTTGEFIWRGKRRSLPAGKSKLTF